MRVGLVGYGRAGRAVAEVLARAEGLQLQWVARRTAKPGRTAVDEEGGPALVGLDRMPFERLLEEQPVDALVDFSSAATVYEYGDAVRQRGITLVTAISAYDDAALAYLRALGAHCRVLSSPNITLGINFLMLAANMLRNIAPFADVQILEQHFREKPEISGTARKIAQQLGLGNEQLTSMRLGGIVGHHEVIFGFPHQTVRLIHESIDRRAFGTGAVFALRELAQRPVGFYTYDQLLLKIAHEQLVRLSTE